MTLDMTLITKGAAACPWSTHEPTRGGGQQYSGGQKCGIWASSLHHLGISGAQLWGCVREAPL